jgi:hypothetical protein
MGHYVSHENYFLAKHMAMQEMEYSEPLIHFSEGTVKTKKYMWENYICGKNNQRVRTIIVTKIRHLNFAFRPTKIAGLQKVTLISTCKYSTPPHSKTI